MKKLALLVLALALTTPFDATPFHVDHIIIYPSNTNIAFLCDATNDCPGVDMGTHIPQVGDGYFMHDLTDPRVQWFVDSANRSFRVGGM